MTYDVIQKNKEIKVLEDKYTQLCNEKRQTEEELLDAKLKFIKKLNKINSDITDINITMSRNRREFHLNKIDASRVEKLRKQFSRKREKLFKDLTKTYGNKCHYCSRTDSLDIHHLVPLSHGGDNSIENLVLACQDCHEGLH